MTSIKKTFTIAVLLITGLLPMQAQENTPYGNKDIQVEFTNELKSLAEGYALAFNALPVGAKYIMVRGDNGAEYLGSARSVKAFEGVLLVELEKGIFTAVSARDIVSISNKRSK